MIIEVRRPGPLFYFAEFVTLNKWINMSINANEVMYMTFVVAVGGTRYWAGFHSVLIPKLTMLIGLFSKSYIQITKLVLPIFDCVLKENGIKKIDSLIITIRCSPVNFCYGTVHSYGCHCS